MKIRASVVGALVVIGAVVGLVVAPHAQQPPAPAAGGRGQAPPAGRGAPTAPPGINWPSPPLPDGPILEDTGIVHQIRIVPTKGLIQPSSMAFLPDGGILVTRARGMSSYRPQRGSRSQARCRPAGDSGGGPRRPDGHRAASALRREPAGLSDVPQAGRRQPRHERRASSRRPLQSARRWSRRQRGSRPRRGRGRSGDDDARAGTLGRDRRSST